MMVEIIIVRHSERYDEKHNEEWLNKVDEYDGKRDKFCLSKDSPITKKGVQLAIDASVTVKNMLQEKYPHLQPVIFASKMTRTVQTAHQIALALDLPVHLCSGLSLIVSHVAKRKGTFEFLSIPELKMICPGVVFHDSDLSTAEYPVACTSSDTSLKAISEISQLHNKIPIVVAHKETIKMLSGDVQTPYCCIGVYQYLLEAVNSTSIRNDRSKNSEEELDQKASGATEEDLESSSPFSLIHLYDRNGIAVQSIDTN